jgi:nitrite reductase (NADH) large subunit
VHTIVIVGNGMVSVRLIDRLRRAGSDARIVVFGEEPRPAYDRVNLTRWFETRDADALSLGGLDWYAARGVELRLG